MIRFLNRVTTSLPSAPYRGREIDVDAVLCGMQSPAEEAAIVRFHSLSMRMGVAG